MSYSFTEKKRIRKDFGKHVQVIDAPFLLSTQVDSYRQFLQDDLAESDRDLKGLHGALSSVFPIASYSGNAALEYVTYQLGKPEFDVTECKLRGMTYAAPLRVTVRLVIYDKDSPARNKKVKEVKEQDVYMGDLPLMTETGTFIINGTERVIVNQMHRSPGVFFDHDRGKTHSSGKLLYKARVIPYRGSWLDFEFDPKDAVFTRIDRRRKLPVTILLRALGMEDEEILSTFFEKSKITLRKSDAKLDLVPSRLRGETALADITDKSGNVIVAKDRRITARHVKQIAEAGVKSLDVGDEYLIGRILAHNIVDSDSGELLASCNDEITAELLETLRENKVKSFDILYVNDLDQGPYISNTLRIDPTSSELEALWEIYEMMRPGEPPTKDAAQNLFKNLFFTEERYDLSAVGRMKFNRRVRREELEGPGTLDRDDILAVLQVLIDIRNGNGTVDDIDHLGNRRVRSVGEMAENQFRIGLVRVERAVRERLSMAESEGLGPQDLINAKPVAAAIKEFFGSSQLSQFMDQNNPLSEVTHKRRVSALGPGGLTRERAGFEVRDVHPTHYGRVCPIETPEGPNIGLINSLATYARTNEYGFLETPYRKVENGKVTEQVEYLSAIDEAAYVVAQASAPLSDKGEFVEELVDVRHQNEFQKTTPDKVQYMDVSPKQVVSVAASLIPFLEHDDANRALMGSNMQRQSVPLVFPEAPRVGTGMEGKTAYDSGVLLKAKRAGTVEYVNNQRIVIKPDDAKDPDERDVYKLVKFQRTNQDTCFNHKPLVHHDQKIEAGQAISDGPATDKGELALGRNVLVGFVPWNGYNYEDAILISEKVVREDIYTSIHIKEFTIDIRETKLGPEKLTRDIPNVSEKALEYLDEEGITSIGAKVSSGSILVGKVTPKSETETTPEFKLLNSIFGEKAKEVKDSSLRIPHGTEGTVIDVQRLKRSEGDDLSPGVDEVVKVLIATKRKLREGDKMAGRHGNKGVVARVLPEEDMPYMNDGTPLDLCLNPMGVPSRMNLGQLLENELGWAALGLDEWYSTPIFQSATPEMISDKLKEAGLPANSKTEVRDGRTGEPFENEVFVGLMYMLKLHHLVDDKMHARSTGPYSLVTQQPLGGKAQFGGQRLGEMEVWALEAYGAANTLQELLTIKSDDMNGRAKIYESIVKGEPATSAGVPESFNVLVQELRGLALDISIFDSKGKRIALTERDEELINRQGSQF